MKRKVRKYVEGGYGDSYSEDFGMGTREEMIERNIEENERRRQAEQLKPSTTLAEFEEPSTAGFSRAAITPTPVARKAAAPAPRPKPATPKLATQPSGQTSGSMGRTAMGKTVAQEMAAIEAGRTAAGKADLERRMAYDKPLERVNPEASLIGGPALRGLRAAGAGLASKITPQAAKPRVEPRIPQEAAKAAPKKPDADYYYGAKSPKMAEKPGAMTTKPPRGGEVAKGSEPKGGSLATKSGQLARRGKDAEQLEMPKKRLPYEKDMGPVEYAAAKNKRRLLERDRRSDDVIESRKSGGKVGSASKRADGIATRGKTRGRYI
jgi:hypothetical protein